MVGLEAKVLGRLGRTENSPSRSVCSILPIARHLRAGEVSRALTPARASLVIESQDPLYEEITHLRHTPWPTSVLLF
jgi:hypothetical protein